MSIPTPSFWKIRKYLLIAILIIYCFVIGSLKQAFGAYPGECFKIQSYCSQNETYTSGVYAYSSIDILNINTSNPNITLTNWSLRPGPVDTKNCSVTLWYYENSNWTLFQSSGGLQRVIASYQQPGEPVSNPDSPPSGTCPLQCEEGEEETACGCKPICPSGQRLVPSCDCIPYCPYTNGRTPRLISNPGGLCVEPDCTNNEITNPDGTCTHNCNSGQQMDVTTGECFTPAPNCGPCETLSGMDCIPPDPCQSGFHRNYETCQCDETPEETPECGQGFHYHWGVKDCVPDVVCPGGQYWNGERCADKVQPPENPPAAVDPKNLPTATPERPADPTPLPEEQPTPEPVTSRLEDPWTAAVKDAVDRTNTILKDTRDDLAKQKTDLTWIQSTMAAVNENIGKAIVAIQRNGAEIAGRIETSINNGINGIKTSVNTAATSINNSLNGLGNSLSNKLTDVKNGITSKLTEIGTQLSNIVTQVTGAVNGVKDGIIDAIGNLRGQLTGIDAGIGNVTEELRKINNGAYVTPADKEPYVAPEHDFNVRTTQFLDTVKSSPIFALPNQLSSSIPGGGSPILSINTGSTYGGEIQIDFSELSDGLLVLRALFQIMGITLAIRIITLKR